jgi:hypothetical protein
MTVRLPPPISADAIQSKAAPRPDQLDELVAEVARCFPRTTAAKRAAIELAIRIGWHARHQRELGTIDR